MADFEVTAIIICDDVRKEISGKDIIIGAYSGEIVVPQLPVQIPLSFWIEATSKKSGHLEFELQVEAPSSEHPLHIRIAAEVASANETFSIHTPQIGFPVSKEGQIKISMRPIGHAKWRLLKRKNVKYIPPPQQARS